MNNEILHLFFAGKASIKEEEEILKWIDESKENRDILLAERRLFDSIIMSDKAKYKDKESSPVRRVLLGRMRYAVSVAALVVAGLLSIFYYQEYNELLLKETTVYTPAGQRVAVVLPDGTNVVLNSGSSITYPSTFAGKQRVVALKGEAFLDVAKEASRPFIVETELCNVEVLGTQFYIDAYKPEQEVVTTLVEGRVRVTENMTFKNIEIEPGQRVVCTPSKIGMELVLNDDYKLWRRNIFAFQGLDFATMLKEMARVYNVRFKLDDGFEVPNATYTGRIHISDGVNHAMRILQSYADFSYVRAQEDKNIIKIGRENL